MKRLTAVWMAVGVTAWGATLEFQGEPARRIEDVPIYARARALIPGVTPAEGKRLFLTGAGLREKKIVLFNVDVYVATHYLDGEPKLSREAPMEGIKKSGLRVLQLTMLRDLGADKIRDSFAEALEANKVDPKSVGIADLLRQITFDVKKGETFTFVGYPLPNGAQGIYYELNGKPFKAEAPQLADKFWSIWFGTPADGGMERLKPALAGAVR